MSRKKSVIDLPDTLADVDQIDIIGVVEKYAGPFGTLANLRLIPDVLDGLIPVRRRILFTADAMGLTAGASTKKSAMLVGETMGKFHPHGDASIYGAAANMAIPWGMRYPLMVGEGNFGSLDGDTPAAMRYTEMKMAALGMLCVRDLFDKDASVVDWGTNYDESYPEPNRLPARFPVLLANGHDGIGWGDASKIMPHNLRELIDAAILLIDDPKVSTEAIIKVFSAPDFPGGAILVENADWAAILEGGKGRVTIRAKMHIEDIDNRHQAIVVTELPYQVQKGYNQNSLGLIPKIMDLVNETEAQRKAGKRPPLLGVVDDIRDETQDEDIRIVIILAQGIAPDNAMQILLRETKVTDKGPGLQKTFNVNQTVLIDGLAETMGSIGILKSWIGHQFDVLTRRTTFFLRRALAQMEVEEAKVIAHGNAEALVRLVKAAGSEDEIKTQIIAKYKVTPNQAQFIANLPLKTYGKMNMDAVRATIARLVIDTTEYRRLLTTREAMAELLKTEMREIRAKFGDDRRTIIDTKGGATIKTVDELLPDGACWIAVTQSGLVGRYPESAFKAQKRGGAGLAGTAKPDEDPLVSITSAAIRSKLYLITNMGNLFGLRAADLDEVNRTNRGTNVRRFLGLADGEQVISALVAPRADDPRHLILATANGKVLRTRLSDYGNLTSAGLKAIGISGSDRVVSVSYAASGQHLMAVSSDGYAARFDLDDVPINGRGAGGVVSIKLGSNATVVSCLPVDAADKGELALILDNGRGKRSPLDGPKGYPLKGRGIRGIQTVDLGTAGKGKATKIVFAAPVGDEDQVIFTTSRSRAILMVATEIKRQGRATAGVIIVNLSSAAKDPESVVSGTVVAAAAAGAPATPKKSATKTAKSKK